MRGAPGVSTVVHPHNSEPVGGGKRPCGRNCNYLNNNTYWKPTLDLILEVAYSQPFSRLRLVRSLLPANWRCVRGRQIAEVRPRSKRLAESR